MQIDRELEEILLRWEQHRDRGETVSPAELCSAHPERLAELERLIEALERVDDLIGANGDAPTEAPGDRVASAALPDEVSTGSRFRALRVHARGGLGEVLVAWDEDLRREVALKLIQPATGRDAHRRERFLREAEITARLGHPGIVPIFGLGQAGDGRPCYTMRFIEGETLQAAIDRFHNEEGPRPDPHERALALRALVARLVAVCQAVAFAHSKGVIHRDIKPANVMLGAYQETLVVDWGLAKRWKAKNVEKSDAADPLGMSEESRLEAESEARSKPSANDAEAATADSDALTRMGSTLGTPAYMSPEQAAGRWDEVGPASDIYSLGATLYCLLTGRPAVQSRSRSTLLEHVRKGQFPPPRQVNPDTPAALEAICLKAMALRPEDRYAGAVELAADLDRWLADEPVLAWREPASLRVARWVRRNRPLVAGSVALAATALVALALSTALLGREQSKTKLALDDAKKNYRLARTTMADVQTSFGLSAAERKAPAEAALWFAEAAATADVDPERALASRIRARSWSRLGPMPVAMLDIPRIKPADRGSAPANARIGFDGSGRFLFADLSGGEFVLYDVEEDRPVPLPESPRTVTAAAWSGRVPDILALGDRNGGVELVRVPGGDIVERLKVKGGVSCLDFSNGGRLLAIGSENTRVWDLDKRSYVTPELAHSKRVACIGFNAQADRLETVTVDGRVRVFDVAASRDTPLFHIDPSATPPARFTAGAPLRPVFVDKGRGIITLPSDRELSWRDATTGQEIRRLPLGLIGVHHVFLSPDGSTLTATGLGGVQAWDSASGQPLARFGDSGMEQAAFIGNGSWLLLSNGYDVTVPYRFPAGDPGGWTLKHQDVAVALAVSPDGGCFALAQRDGLVVVWKLPDEQHGDGPQRRPSWAAKLAMNSDGTLVMPVGRYLFNGPSTTRAHDLVSGQVGPELRVEGILHGGAIAPDGRQAVTLSSPAGVAGQGMTEIQYPAGAAKGAVVFWDWKAGKPLGEPITTPSEPVAAAYRPDGQFVVVLCTMGELLWVDPASRRVEQKRGRTASHYAPGWPGNDLMRFSPDGKLLAEWGTGPPALFDATTGAQHAPTLKNPGKTLGHTAFNVRFSADGRYFATVGMEKEAQVWDLTTGQPAAPVLRHPDWVFDAAFSADGSMLLTGARDMKARVWDWRKGKVLGLPMAHQGEVQDVAFLEGDAFLLTKSSVGELASSTDNAVQVWEWRTGKPLTPARQLLSAWGIQLRVSPDGRFAVMAGGQPGEMHVVDVAAWIDSEDPRFPAQHLSQTAELISGQKIVGGSSVVSLRTIEWVERWRACRDFVRARRAQDSGPLQLAGKPLSK